MSDSINSYSYENLHFILGNITPSRKDAYSDKNTVTGLFAVLSESLNWLLKSP